MLANTKELDLSDNAIDKLSRGFPTSLVALNLSTVKFVDLINQIMENERLMLRKVPDLKKGENARTSLGIELACLALHIPAPREDLLRIAGIKSRDYLIALEKCKTLMCFQQDNRNTIEIFAVKYSSPDVGAYALSLLQAYIHKYQEEERNKYSKPPDYQSALYQGAAFYIAAKIKKLKSVPKREVFFKSLDSTNSSLFYKLCHEIEVS